LKPPLRWTTSLQPTETVIVCLFKSRRMCATVARRGAYSGEILQNSSKRPISSGAETGCFSRPELAEYLWKHGPIDPSWALSVIELILGNSHVEASEFHFAGGEELIRLVLRVYSDPLGGAALREHAMNVFDQLLMRSPGPAQMVLQEFDRR
jgi:hypothetical protein